MSESMRQGRVLVTGASGFIGHHLCRFLKAKGFYVVGVDINSNQYQKDIDKFYQLDLKDSSACFLVTTGMDWVFNLAALNGSIELTTNNKAELVHNNALINLNMAEACHKNKVDRVFFASSACVYPMDLQGEDEHALTESDVAPANPDTEYGWEKLFSEHVYLDYAADYGMDVRIARFINIYGTECLIDTLKSKAPMALTRKVIEAAVGGVVNVWGDGEQRRTFCYIDDLCEGIFKLMLSNVKEPINLGSNVLVTINQLVEMIARIECKTVNINHQLDKVQGVRTRQADISKAKELLDWQPTTLLADGLHKVNQFVHQELKK